MGLFDWFKGHGRGEDARLVKWRSEWRQVADAEDTTRRDALARELDALGLTEDEVEIEREMLEALERLAEIRTTVETTSLPTVETGHRVVGADVCHFISPASMPDEPSQPSGRLLLTSARAIFVGGANGSAVPWHAIGEVTHADRDLVLIRGDKQRTYRFRCNSFADALTGAFLARRLAGVRRRPAGGL